MVRAVREKYRNTHAAYQRRQANAIKLIEEHDKRTIQEQVELIISRVGLGPASRSREVKRLEALLNAGVLPTATFASLKVKQETK